MPVLPPGPDALERLIEEPARMAGLRFEERDGVSLARRIFREALTHAELLPLLEFVLRELYEKSTDADRLLTHAAYDELGGIEGAVGEQAEDLYGSLPEDSQVVLDEILPLLVTVETSGEQSAVRRRAGLDELRSTPERRALVDSLIARRFLTTDRQDHESVASFTHEALLRRWDRIARWVKLNHEHLRVRARVLAAVTDWEKHKRRNDLLLAAGKPLDEANELTQSKIALEKVVVEFIALSTARVQRNHRLRRLAIASLFVLTILSILASGIAWDAMRRAGKREQDALASQRALRQQVYDNSIAIAEREINMNEDIGKASTLLEGENCPNEVRGWEWHYLMRLRDGERAPLEGHKTGLWGAEFSPDGRLIATCSIDGTIKIWDAATGRLLRTIEADRIEGLTNLMGLFKLPGSRSCAWHSARTARRSPAAASSPGRRCRFGTSCPGRIETPPAWSGFGTWPPATWNPASKIRRGSPSRSPSVRMGDGSHRRASIRTIALPSGT